MADKATTLPSEIRAALLSEQAKATLKRHQMEAIEFLWGALRVEQFLTFDDAAPKRPVSPRGALLAHAMGLGKTCTVLLLLGMLHLCWHQLHPAKKPISVLVICPKTALRHWPLECQKFLTHSFFSVGSDDDLPPVYLIDPDTPIPESKQRTGQWQLSGGIAITTYERFSKMIGPLSASSPMSWLLGGINDPRPTDATQIALRAADVVVLDEIHRAKHSKTALWKALLGGLRSVPLRIGMTGTPLQNHLRQYVAMLEIVSPGAIASPQDFEAVFEKPIALGQCVDATNQQFVEMQKRVSQLRSFMAKYAHRCGVEVLEKELPPRTEICLFVSMTQAQAVLYNALVQQLQQATTPPASKSNTSGSNERCAGAAAIKDFAAFLAFRHLSSRVCAHPILVPPNLTPGQLAERDSSKQKKRLRSDVALPPKARLAASRPSSSSSDESSDGEQGSDATSSADEADEATRFRDRTVIQSFESSSAFTPESSSKLALCLELVQRIRAMKEKVVIFSTYVIVLRFLQAVLQRFCSITADCLDGSATSSRRMEMIDAFTHEGPQEKPVILCSLLAGGVGINLVAANHCILFDHSWNPPRRRSGDVSNLPLRADPPLLHLPAGDARVGGGCRVSVHVVKAVVAQENRRPQRPHSAKTCHRVAVYSTCRRSGSAVDRRRTDESGGAL